uniref:Uncharacterized protein n=1 Tax=Rhizophora mucronata TaxID=61149 RepID=A0A2P2M5J2_RHIMU
MFDMLKFMTIRPHEKSLQNKQVMLYKNV